MPHKILLLFIYCSQKPDNASIFQTGPSSPATVLRHSGGPELAVMAEQSRGDATQRMIHLMNTGTVLNDEKYLKYRIWIFLRTGLKPGINAKPDYFTL
jgi:hypothetical protein